MVSVHSRPDRPITVRGAGINGYFVAGSDTEVGKTVVAACLVRALDADYWKPVETGLEQGSDTAEVLRLTGLPADRLHPSAYALQVPLSPHEAARLEGVEIALDAFVLPATGRPLVVEGAGGLMVPLNFVGAYAFFFADEEIDPTGLWLAGSLTSALFYGAVSLLGMGRWYAAPMVVAVFSGLAAALVLTDAPPEVYPGSFIALALVVAVRPEEAARAPSKRGPPTKVCGVR